MNKEVKTADDLRGVIMCADLLELCEEIEKL